MKCSSKTVNVISSAIIALHLWHINLKFRVVSHCSPKLSCCQFIYCVQLCFICPVLWDLKDLLNKPESFTDNSFGHQSDNPTSRPGGPRVSRQKSHCFPASQTSLRGQARTSDILYFTNVCFYCICVWPIFLNSLLHWQLSIRLSVSVTTPRHKLEEVKQFSS